MVLNLVIMKFFTVISLVLAWQFVSAQSADDSYTRYELLDPVTQSFRIIYDVSATTPGTAYYYNTLRKGSEHKVDAVIDRMTGQNLEWKIVSGTDAKKAGYTEAQPDGEYLQIRL